VSCARTAEPIDLPFGLWTPVGRRKHKFSRIRHVAPMCVHEKAHWRHLANTVEPFVCGGDAVLCQVTLTSLLVNYLLSAVTLGGAYDGGGSGHVICYSGQ